MSKIVLALGGNALGNTPSTQKKAVEIVAKVVVDLSQQNHQVIICHGNGPQVGTINNVFEAAIKNKLIDEIMPFAECGSMSQGYIGFHLQNAIQNELLKRENNYLNVATIVTQTIVDKNDPKFLNPSKPIGGFMEEKEAKELAFKYGFIVKSDAGRGWRRVVPSPIPKSIKEIKIVEQLLSTKNNIIIAGGGGGIPVYQENNKLIGVDAVIDKDLTSAKIAELVNADSLIILTAVDYIKINYHQPNEKSLKEVSITELKKHIEDNQFAPGSMLPKVEAAIKFVGRTKNNAYIGLLENAPDIIKNMSGTKVVA